MNAGEKQVPTPPLSSGESIANSAAEPVPATAVRDQLARVVNSPGFVSSVRLCRFLTHVVNRTIDGDIDSLKEFSIGLSASDCARMAYLHYVKGDYSSAAEHLQHSFELDRDYPEARLYEGLLHFQQQRYDAVIQCLSPSASPLDIGLLAAAHAQEGSLSRAEEG